MKKFNVAGVCIKELHYMVDITDKLNEIKNLILNKEYFTINKARQFGKTTTLNLLYNLLKEEYIIISISFEGIGEKIFSNEELFCQKLLQIIIDDLSIDFKEASNSLNDLNKNIETMFDLSTTISTFIKSQEKDVILIIDEIDKSSNNKLFLDFLGMLRSKFLRRQANRDNTFSSVILSSVHDIKNLKLKIRADEEISYNSPWNIASDFKVDLSFNQKEIKSMISEYEFCNKTNMDVELISNELYKFTNGYPFLVSQICKIIDENLNKNWTITGINSAINKIISEKSTLMDDLSKNLLNNKKISKLLHSLLLKCKQIYYNNDTPEIYEAELFSLIRVKTDDTIAIHNLIFEKRIYNYFISKINLDDIFDGIDLKSNFINSTGELNLEKVLIKFKEVINEQKNNLNSKFIEENGRILFLVFLKPILNGKGFYFVEPRTRNNRRMDLVITFNSKVYIIELKIWHGKKYNDSGISQLLDYMEYCKQDIGYLLTFNFNSNSIVDKWDSYNNKKIYSIYV